MMTIKTKTNIFYMLLFSSHKRKNKYHRIDVEVPLKFKTKWKFPTSSKSQNVYLCILFNLPVKE